jgi:hypothetical protein
MPKPSKSYSEHLQSIQSCRHRWRITTLSDVPKQQSAGDLAKFRVVPVSCKSLSCIYCRRKYFNKIRHQVNKIGITEKWAMFTLTGVHHTGEEVSDLQRLEINFRELRKKLKRRFPKLKYFAVKELSPRGNWHLHGVWNIYIEQKELSEMWEKISGACIVWLKLIWSPAGAINYVFSYIFKSENNREEHRQLYENSKRKFTTSSKLLSEVREESPYKLYGALEYTVNELKEEICNIIATTDATFDDFSAEAYPYFDVMIYQAFEEFYCKPREPEMWFDKPQEVF